MKKLVFVFAAFAAISFASCQGNKTTEAAATDSVADTVAVDTVCADSACADSACADSVVVVEA